MNTRSAFERGFLKLLVLILIGLICCGDIQGQDRSNKNEADDGRPIFLADLQVQMSNECRISDSAYIWNWSAWDQDKVVTFGQFQYTVFWDEDMVLVIGRRDLDSGVSEKLRLEDYKLKNNDRHRNTCLGVSKDGRLHLSWDHHNDPLRYTKTRAGFLNDPPERIQTSDFETAVGMLDDRSMETRVTYPRFLNDRNGELFFFYRIGASGNGDNYLHRYDANSGTWSRIGMVFSRRGTYDPWESSTSRNAYFHDILFDKNNRLHATWTYREVGRTWASNHNLHYAYSDDHGVTWKNSHGELVANLEKNDPIELSDPGLMVVEIPVYSWLMNAGPMNLDSKNRPHVITFKCPEVQAKSAVQHSPTQAVRDSQVYVHYWRDDDGTFRGGQPIDPGPLGAKRGDFVFDREDNIFFFYTTDEGLRYFTARADDQWSNFSGPHKLTDDSFTAPLRDATKHDRLRWQKEGILSITATPKSGGFSILDFKLD